MPVTVTGITSTVDKLLLKSLISATLDLGSAKTRSCAAVGSPSARAA
ncbi:hypothetical protein [Bradyrhizobium sp. WSM3983]|nr:hypothetical protein [Bradyrhizobium sp. WSM3983]